MKLRYAIMIALALAMFYGVLEHESVRVEEAIRRDPPIFQRPLACDAIVSQRSVGEPFISKCYIRGNK